jgi:hypothetical protein
MTTNVFFTQLSKFIIIFIIFIVSNFVNALSSASSGWMTPRIQLLDIYGEIHDTQSLPDIGYKLSSFLPVFITSWETGPYIIQTFFIISLYFLLIVHPLRLKILSRCMIIFSIINFIRSISIMVTYIPDSNPICLRQWKDMNGSGAYKKLPMWPANIKRALLLLVEPSAHTTCGDMIFSGHMVFITMVYKIYSEYFHTSTLSTHLPVFFINNFRRLVKTMAFVGAGVIIATKLHYTIDVIIAIYITHEVFTKYHILIK